MIRVSLFKNPEDVLCHLIIQDTNDIGKIFYRFSTWYKNDPNRYININYSNEWIFNKPLQEMKQYDIVTDDMNINYKVFNCLGNECQLNFCKILERSK